MRDVFRTAAEMWTRRVSCTSAARSVGKHADERREAGSTVSMSAESVVVWSKVVQVVYVARKGKVQAIGGDSLAVPEAKVSKSRSPKSARRSCWRVGKIKINLLNECRRRTVDVEFGADVNVEVKSWR